MRTRIDAPLLNTASLRSPSPMMLYSAEFHAVARSVMLSFSLVVNASVPTANTTESLPPLTALPDTFSSLRSATLMSGTVTAALLEKQSPSPSDMKLAFRARAWRRSRSASSA